jgi:RNA polymerase sigma factor (sigma-70 family)
MTDVATSRPALGDRDRPDPSLHQHRAELTGYCYRMLGSAVDAEDAVQETLIRAWRGQQGFEGRAALRSWLYRIATNVCIDMLKGRQRRARPMDLSAPSSAGKPLPPALPDDVWVQPIPDKRLLSSATDPGDAVASQESIRLAFVAAVQVPAVPAAGGPHPSRRHALADLRGRPASRYDGSLRQELPAASKGDDVCAPGRATR